jgi:hypothetical protein
LAARVRAVKHVGDPNLFVKAITKGKHDLILSSAARGVLYGTACDWLPCLLLLRHVRAGFALPLCE